MHYEQQPPTFFHKRPPIITQKVQKQTKMKSRLPISDEQLKRLLLKHQPSNNIHIQKINIKRTLLTHLAYQKNLEESINYNRIKLTNHLAVKLLLVDTSYSMNPHTDTIRYYLKNWNYDIILFHDQSIFDYNKGEIPLPKFIGGTSFYTPLKQIEKTKIKAEILHLTDGDNSPNDQTKTEQIVKRLSQKGSTYKRIIIKENH